MFLLGMHPRQISLTALRRPGRGLERKWLKRWPWCNVMCWKQQQRNENIGGVTYHLCWSAWWRRCTSCMLIQPLSKGVAVHTQAYQCMHSWQKHISKAGIANSTCCSMWCWSFLEAKKQTAAVFCLVSGMWQRNPLKIALWSWWGSPHAVGFSTT